ncbi:MAG: PilZ domain-containing protein [Deltaproteobacteria bacterium]|nr:PilZ domain-containing protein [Deltaproteobacteria bacterium]MBW2393329.1 PilZ domain-containing protein [Deltaproteobacteria bacterium]
MAARAQALVIGFGHEEAKIALCDRLWAVGFRALPARDTVHATDLLTRDEPIRVALVSSEAPDPASLIERLREARPAEMLRILLVGMRPDVATIDAARAAGAKFGLWEPYHESELRFVINQAAFDSTRGDVRDELRVPSQLAALVYSGSGRKPTGVYNLSLRGAYLETPRPTGSGANIKVEFLLEDGPVVLQAEVISTNVPGNLRKANRPIGMGIRFTEVGDEEEESLEKYILLRAGIYDL